MFCTLLEYAVVLFLDAGRKRRLRNSNIKKWKKLKKKQCDSLIDDQSLSNAFNNYQVRNTIFSTVKLLKCLCCSEKKQQKR